MSGVLPSVKAAIKRTPYWPTVGQLYGQTATLAMNTWRSECTELSAKSQVQAFTHQNPLLGMHNRIVKLHNASVVCWASRMTQMPSWPSPLWSFLTTTERQVYSICLWNTLKCSTATNDDFLWSLYWCVIPNKIEMMTLTQSLAHVNLILTSYHSDWAPSCATGSGPSPISAWLILCSSHLVLQRWPTAQSGSRVECVWADGGPSPKCKSNVIPCVLPYKVA